MSRSTAFLSALGLILTIGFTTVGPATASTPDGETPANEGVCDALQGGTPGLYGLCVAYCEAQDLDIVGDKETPSNKILANYRKKMRDGDPDMPCIQVPCPCWSESELAAITTPTNCSYDANTAVIRSTTQFAIIDTSRPLCRFTDRNTTPPISRRFSGSDAVPPDAAQTCYSQVVAACDASGL